MQYNYNFHVIYQNRNICWNTHKKYTQPTLWCGGAHIFMHSDSSLQTLGAPDEAALVSRVGLTTLHVNALVPRVGLTTLHVNALVPRVGLTTLLTNVVVSFSYLT